MKRILINATHNEEIRVALCKDNHLYDFDLENRTREQKKANIYKGHITRVEPSLEAVFVEYGSARQGFLPLREIAPEYLKGNPRTDNIRDIIKEGDEVIIQVEKEERGNKGAALSTYISLAGRYLVLMPNNAKAGGVSRQISGKVREETKSIISSLSIPRGMSVIVRTAGLGKGFDDLQNDLHHLLEIWQSILTQNQKRPSPCLVHQEAGVVTRAVRDYLRDDIGEVWIDSEHAYNEAASFIAAVMPNQMGKLRKYTDYEPLFARFGIERQIETAYQREVRLPSGGSIVIDQTEALVSIDINSAKSTKGSDVAETAYHTNLEAADEIARQLRLRDMGGLIVIDFIDMNETRHQKDVEKRLIDATRYDRARVQFAEISRFGLMEMSRQRLRPSLEESTGYICPRCHGNGMIRDLRSLALSIMRQIEQIALKERMGEIQAEVPTEIAAFLLNEKRESLVYLEQDSGARITILPHAHLESPNFSLHFNPDGFAPSSYERIVDVEEREAVELGYDTNWHTKADNSTSNNRWQKAPSSGEQGKVRAQQHAQNSPSKSENPDVISQKPQAVAWLANLFAPKPQASLAGSLSNSEVAAAIESLVNSGNVSLGSMGMLGVADEKTAKKGNDRAQQRRHGKKDDTDPRAERQTQKDDARTDDKKRAAKESPRDSGRSGREDAREYKEKEYSKRDPGSQRPPRGEAVRGETLKPIKADDRTKQVHADDRTDKPAGNDLNLKVVATPIDKRTTETVHLSLDGSKSAPVVQVAQETATQTTSSKSTKTKPKKADASEGAVAKGSAQSEVTSDAVIGGMDALSPSADQQAHEAHDEMGEVTQAEIRVYKAPKAATKKVASALSPNPEQVAKLADATGRALNDPRVVLQVTDKPKRPAKTTSRAQSTVKLSGSAGQFVASLVSERTQDFVADFLTAIRIYETRRTATTDVQFSQDGDILGRLAEFANYGFEALSADDLAHFDAMITPKGQFSSTQGKTKVELPIPTLRALNDPRGAYVVSEPVQVSESAPTTAESSTTLIADVDAGETLVETLQQVVTDAVHSIGELLSFDGKTVDGETVGGKAVDDETGSGLRDRADEPAPIEAEAIADDTKRKSRSKVDADDSKSTTGNAPDDKAQDAVLQDAPSEPQKSETSRSPKKSAIANYKNMIENVAEQLLPQVGILSLAVPKATKTASKATAKSATKATAIKPKIAPKKTRTSNKPKSEVIKKTTDDSLVQGDDEL